MTSLNPTDPIVRPSQALFSCLSLVTRHSFLNLSQSQSIDSHFGKDYWID